MLPLLLQVTSGVSSLLLHSRPLPTIGSAETVTPVAPRQSSAEPVLDWEGLCHLSCAPFTVLREKNQLSTSPKCDFSAVGLSLETKRTDKQSIYNLQHQHHFMLLFFHLKLSFLSIK